MALSQDERIGKVITISRTCGFPGIPELVDHYLFDTACPAICLSCDYVEERAPDEDYGWLCHAPTMTSALVLVGVVSPLL